MSCSSALIVALFLLSGCGGSFSSSGPGPSGGAPPGGSGGASAGASAGAGAPSAGSSSGGRSSGGANSGGAGGGTLTRVPALHRPEATACGTPPTPSPTPGASGPLPPPVACTMDSECTAGPNGRCLSGRIGRYCGYDGCFADAGCAAGAVCQCGIAGGVGNRCLAAEGCQVDADCPNSWCSPTFGSCGNYSGVVGYACHTAKDECVDDADCGANPAGLGGYCMFDPMVAHWLCSTSQCVG